MTDIFLSYKREDEARVARLAQALEKAGLSVWWDRELVGGESWRRNIQSALDQAKCVVVAWTRESVGPAGDFVRDEAGQAKARGLLVPVLLQRVRVPLGFGEVQAIDLAHWRGDARDPFFRDLVETCRAKIEGKSPPPPRGPLARLARRLTVGGAAGAIAAGALAFAANFLQVQNHVCTIPVGQPALSDVCGAVRLGNRSTHEERVAFARLPAGDCEALRAFRDRYEQSPLRALADSRLASREVVREERWVASVRQDPVLFVAADGAGARDEELAHAAALARAQPHAERLCRNFAASTMFRFKGATPTPQAWSCARAASGIVCGFEGVADCDIEEKEGVERETCGGGE